MKRPLSAFRAVTGTTRSEALVVLSILGALVCGYVVSTYQRLHEHPWDESIIARDIASMLDSVATGTTHAAPFESGSSDHPFTGAARTRAAVSQPSGPVNLNKATVDQLMTLPGVGERTAQKIIARRSMRRYLTIEDIMDVPGIGQKKFEKMRPFLRVQ
jgi:competence ComEA-like helix-hairpin-helix protein